MAAAHAARPALTVSPAAAVPPPGSPASGLADLLFEQCEAGLILVDGAGRIVRANPAARRATGPHADLAPGAAAAALFAEAERTSLLAACRRAGAAPASTAPSSTVKALYGGGLVDVSVEAVHDVALSAHHVLLRLADPWAHSRRQEAQRQRRLEELTGGIVHDLGNLLTAIGGAAEELAAQSGLPMPANEEVAVIRDGVERGGALVRRLLRLAGPDQEPPRPVCLDAAIAEIAALLRRLLGGGVRLELALDAPDAALHAEPAQLDQVLVNLAVNARHAMAEGGTLTVRTGRRRLEAAATSIGHAMPPGRYVLIEVADTGIGIAADQIARIFEPFVTTRRERGGSGLGLATVHDIVRAWGGRVSVESAVGQGATFRILCPEAYGPDPAAPGQAQALSIGPQAQSAELHDRTILLVEDEAAVRRLAEHALARAGWEVLAAEDGDAALALLSARPGLRLAGLVTDLTLPGMDGRAVLRAVRTASGQGVLPALLMSGYTDAGREGLVRQPMVAFLAKPYAPHELVEAVGRLLGCSPVP